MSCWLAKNEPNIMELEDGYVYGFPTSDDCNMRELYEAIKKQVEGWFGKIRKTRLEKLPGRFAHCDPLDLYYYWVFYFKPEVA